MQRRIVILLCSVLCASPAWAMRAHDYIDADQRAKVTLRGEQRTPVVTVAAPAPTPNEADASLLPTAEQAQAAAAKSVVSPVPEPSGYVMLGLGLLLLLLRPSQQDGEAIPCDPEKPHRL